MSDREILETLDKAVVTAGVALGDALAAENWAAAIEATVHGLLRRACALAIRHGVPGATLDFRADERARVLVLKQYLIANASALDLTHPDPYGARESVLETIDAVVAAVNALEHNVQAADRGARLMMMGGRLGWADTLLGLSEEGLWDQMDRWRRRRGGRASGYTAPWRQSIAPEIQKWINAEPHMKKSVLAKMVGDWFTEKGHVNIHEDSISKALREMAKAGLYRWPD